MPKAAADNDVLFKGAWFGLARELLAQVPVTPAETLILGHAKFVVAKRMETLGKKGAPNAAQAKAQFAALLDELLQVEPTPEEQAIAADLENAASSAGVALDSGESLLCAVLVQRDLRHLVTGDKRAIAALEVLAGTDLRLAPAEGKVLCLEQLFARLLARVDPATVRSAVCQNAHVDRALAMCFSCASTEVGPDQWLEGLSSYIESVRDQAPKILSRTVP